MPPQSNPPAINEKFGRWTVIGEPLIQTTTQGRLSVPCRCDCGTERVVLAQSLRRKDRAMPSCGCWRREQSARQARDQWTTHGHARQGQNDPLYRLWRRIRRRCYDPKAHNYRWYGAVGVRMYEPWRNDAGAFIAYIEQELGPRPSQQHSIDRYPPDANYEPGKIRWATPVEQARNRRPRAAR